MGQIEVNEDASPSTGRGTDETSPRGVSPARIRWAQLLARVYELDPLRCPGCHGTLRILAFLTDPPSSRVSSATSGCPANPRAWPPPEFRPRRGHRREAVVRLRPDAGLGSSPLRREPTRP